MDSKMDSGFLEPGDTLEDTYDVFRELSLEEVIGIMDSLLCLEVAWYMGHPLSTTLFSSVYVDRILWPEPKTIREACFTRNSDQLSMLQRVLRAYCVGLIKTCDFVLERVSHQTYYEEEDFCINLYNRPLLTAFDVEEIVRVLDESLLALENSKTASPNLYYALVSRLEYRKVFLITMAMDIKSAASERKSSWQECSDSFAKVVATHELGLRVPESFSPKIQRRLASSVPPRPIMEMEFDHASIFLKSVYEDGVAVESVLECPSLSNLRIFITLYQARKPGPSVLMRCQLQELMFSKFNVQRTSSDEPNIFFFEELRELVLPASTLLDPANAIVEAPQDDRFHIAQGMDRFAKSVWEPYYEFLRALTMNRSRVRRMLCHVVLEWDGLQLDLEELDSELRRYTHEEPLADAGEEIWEFPLSSWAYDLKLQQMLWIVQLGFELELYLPEELGFMYWYLYYLATARYRHTERILAFVKTNRSKLIHPTLDQLTAVDHCFSVLLFNMEESLATSSFAEALCYLYLTLSSLSLLPSPPTSDTLSYSTPSLRHALRLRPFLALCHPPIPSATDFDSQTLAVISRLPVPSTSHPTIKNPLHLRAIATLTHIDSLLRTARSSWERVLKSEPRVARCVGSEDAWKGSVKDVVRSAITAGLCVAGVRKWILAGCPSAIEEGGIKIDVPGVGSGGGGYHAWWVVPTLVPMEKNRGEEGDGMRGKGKKKREKGKVK